MTRDRTKVLITDCSSGIGYELAKLLSTKNYFVFALYSGESVVEHVEELRSENFVPHRITNESDVFLNGMIKKNEVIEIFVYTHNISSTCTIDDVTVENLSDVMQENVLGFSHLVSRLLPPMKRNVKGHIIAVSSFAGMLGIPFNSVSCTSKFALEGYCESLREELKDFYIRVSLIEVGPVLQEEHKEGSDTSENLITCLKNIEASHQTMGQSPAEIAEKIFTIMEQPQSEDQFRYITNKIYADALSHVLRTKTKISQKHTIL